MSPEDSLSFTSNSSKPDSLQSINMPERKQDVADAYSEKPDFPSPEDCLVKISEDSELEKTNDIQISPKKQTGTLTIELNQMALSCNSSLQGSYASLPNKLTSEKNMRCNWQNEGDGLLKMLSAVYAKLLVVMGVCFPLGEVISHRIPVSYYEGFYLYLYFGSIAFLFYVYIFLLRHQKTVEKSKSGQPTTFCQIFAKKIVPFYRHSSWRLSMKSNTSSIKVSEGRHCGSFYLRLGAVAFGVGSMIYSGLEFGQFFELKRKSHCYNILYGLTPSIRMAFTFIQLYFIFLNSRVAIKKFKTLARFGLMHMIATNMCVWLHVLVAETKHEIMTNINHNLTQDVQSLVLQDEVMDYRRMNVEQYIHSRRKERSIEHEIYISHDCRRANIMGKLVQDVSPFLFPCTIEYSLICAAILYVMWKNIGKINNNTETASSGSYSSRNRHQYTVDCTKANKGLFSGIIILVSAIISLIIFFVLIKKEMYKNLAVMEAHVFELALYILSSIGVIIALIQVKKLKYNPYRNIELDNILLIVAQSGLYVFTMFSIIGGHFTMDQNTVLALLTAVACLIQATLQTIFILNASRRYCKNSNQMRKKPGREMVTFLLVCNFAMWSINTLETRRADSNPVQIHFYGFWAWTIITHVTTPLTIFFRFHSTVCLCDIWKHSYKVRPELI
ncbi:proton channel OtopLc-like isoform X2 [Tachypleus tridentatus]|uniref:proton channel OtopLc-like isoform X2 n=1 Tax=Tachypleus tridentatus TaxID=6853 RepID=UPI003FD52E58